ncbi:MAG: hypothetical protein ABW201_14340 [Candidatus Thiodiazotropha sp.]
MNIRAFLFVISPDGQIVTGHTGVPLQVWAADVARPSPADAMAQPDKHPAIRAGT